MPPDPESQEGEEQIQSGSSAGSVIDCADVTHEYVRSQRSHLLPWRSDTITATSTALEEISFTVKQGETVGIAGPSGSGKSTLLHLIGGLMTPTSGRINLAGSELTSMSAKERTEFRHSHVGMVFQRFHLIPTLSARANVALPLVQLGIRRSKRRERAEKLLERVELEDRIHHTPGQLSGGEQQRVAIARALITDPDVVLADEPTGELDRRTGETVLSVLTELLDETVVVIASHDKAALDVADRVCQIVDGRVGSVTDGTE